MSHVEGPPAADNPSPRADSHSRDPATVRRHLDAIFGGAPQVAAPAAFRSGAYSASRVIGLARLNAVVAALALFAALALMGARNDIYLDEFERSGLDVLAAFVEWGPVVGLVAWVVVYIAWAYRLNLDTRALGVTGLSFTPIGTVIAWLIPSANGILPYVVLSELWRANDPANEWGWREAPMPRPVVMWWGGWYVVIALIYGAHGLMPSYALADKTEGLLLFCVAYVALIVLWGHTLRMIERLQDFREAKYRAALGGVS